MKYELSNHHRDTLEKILRHPASGNIEWRQDLSPFDVAARRVAQDLLERVAMVVVELVFHRVA